MEMNASLKKLLAARQRKTIDYPGYVRSAVLVPICEENGDSYLIFIKRSDNVKVHKGQISFPGGGMDGNDKTLLDTALREASEEIGLRPEDAEILGCLDDEITTTSNYIVTPFVARIPWPYQFRLNKFEVDELFRVPVAALRDRSILKKGSCMHHGKIIPEYSYTYREKVIWGATARILHGLLEIMDEAGRLK